MDQGTEAGRDGGGGRGAPTRLQIEGTGARTFTGNGGWSCLVPTQRLRCTVRIGAWLSFDDAGGLDSSGPSFAPSSDSEWYEL